MNDNDWQTTFRVLESENQRLRALLVVTDEMVKRAATQMRNECGPFFAPQQIAGLFDWEVAARNALAAAFDERQKP